MSEIRIRWVALLLMAVLILLMIALSIVNAWAAWEVVPCATPTRTVPQPYLKGNNSLPKDTAGAGVTVAPRPVTFTNCEFVFRSYSGGWIVDGQYLAIGGGHAGHPGNDVDRFDLATGAWQPLAYPSEAPGPYVLVNGVWTSSGLWRCMKGGGAGCGGVSPTGRPFTGHMYRLCAPALSTSSPSGLLACVLGSGTWTFDAGSGEWAQHAGRDRYKNEPACGAACGVLYDPLTHALWVFASDTQNALSRAIYRYAFPVMDYDRVRSWPVVSGWGWGSKLITAFRVDLTREAVLITSPTGGTLPAVPYRIWRMALDHPAAPIEWDDSILPGDPAYEELKGSDGKWARRCDVRQTTGELWCWQGQTFTHPALGAVTPGWWVQDPQTRAWTKVPCSGLCPSVDWWTVAWDAATDTFIATDGLTLYCGVSAASCGGRARLVRYRP